MVPERAPASAPAPWTLRGNATLICQRRGILAFVQYTESNVGPYDELLWLAPFQRGPAGRAHQVPAIFVSSEASAHNGRINWGLPKELARFELTRLGTDRELVRVTRGEETVASFARTVPRTGLPLDLRLLPRRARTLVQVLDGFCFETAPAARGAVRLTSVSQLRVHGDWLPEARSARWRPGIHVSSFALFFPAARVFALPR
ncbi:MAG TPA: acetoacetate decarboxylase family protein [Polyangiaceae bacterium]|jgi:hypothetical protein|nr:acetoacetate decarboxylase family protein [Polyangiaceae bacterium]